MIGDFVPSTESMVVMVAFTMMALGLNIVVGYAGLLDLGYVAFYAVGAYTAGWFASQQFDQVTFHFFSSVPSDQPGIHITMWLVLVLAGFLTLFAGILIGLPTLRLRGDYLAIVTLGFGEIVPQVVQNGDNLRLRPDPRDVRHRADRRGRLPDPELRGPAEELPDVAEPRALVLRRRVRAPPDHRLLHRPPPRLAARRAWIAIREDETAAAAMGVPLMRTKTWSYAIGAFFGGVAGALLRELQGRRLPRGLLLQHLGLPPCMVILGGMGSVWGVDRRRDDPRRTSTSRASSTIGSKIQEPARLRPDEVPVRDLRGHHRRDDAPAPAGLIPERRHRIELEEGVHDTPFYDVEHEGTLTDRDPSDD